MSRRRFFVERFENGSAALSGDAAHHLVRVLRAEPGQLYELSDGREVFLARLERIGRDVAHFAVLEPIPAEPPSLEIALLVAVVKFDRFEWALEKATELGSAAIVPLAAERSEKALVAAAPKRGARWRKLLQESAQQARCLRAPVLEELARPAEAFRAASGEMRIVLSERPGAVLLRSILSDTRERRASETEARGREAREMEREAREERSAAGAANSTGRSEIDRADAPQECGRQVSLAIGPEGGWTDAELDLARAAGFREAALGRQILRTETAVVAGLAAVQLYLDVRRRAGVSGAAWV